MDFFSEAVAIARAHAAEYICPICGKPTYICTCPSFDGEQWDRSIIYDDAVYDDAAEEASRSIDRDNAVEINRSRT